MKNVKNAFVQSTGIKQIIEEIESRQGAGHRRCPGHLAIIGPSGSGKTTLIEHLKRRFPRTVSENDDQDIVPLLSASFPKDVSALFMAKHLLKQLGDPDYEERDLDCAYDKLWNLLEKCKVDFICFDEFHNIRKGDSLAVSVTAEKFIKDLSNHTKAVMVAFGTADSEDLIDSADELSTRFDEYLYMPSYSAFDGQRNEFEAYLTKLSDYVDVDNPEFIFSNDIPERIYISTKGLPRAMARLIDRAINLAKRSGKSKLCHEDFHNAALRFKSSRQQARVFRLSNKKLAELIQNGTFETSSWNRSFEILNDFFDRKSNFVGAYC